MTKGCSRTSKSVVVRTAVFKESNLIKYSQVVDGHLGKTYGTRIDREHDKDVQVENILPIIHVDVELEGTQQPSSSPLDVVTTYDMDMDINDNALTKDFSSTDIVPRE